MKQKMKMIDIKEAEKQSISGEFQDKDGELMVGTLSREDQKNYFVDLGRASGILPKDQIIPGEKLVMGSSVKVYVSKLELGPKGPFIMLSRSHYGFVKRLLEIEIPELLCNNDSVMKIDAKEIQGAYESIKLAKGRVGIVGLGLGYTAWEMAKKDEVTEVIVYEVSKDVINLYINTK